MGNARLLVSVAWFLAMKITLDGMAERYGLKLNTNTGKLAYVEQLRKALADSKSYDHEEMIDLDILTNTLEESPDGAIAHRMKTSAMTYARIAHIFNSPEGHAIAVKIVQGYENKQTKRQELDELGSEMLDKCWDELVDIYNDPSVTFSPPLIDENNDTHGVIAADIENISANLPPNHTSIDQPHFRSAYGNLR